ncbi:MAG: hypothetical protein IIZ14_00815 [Solobacterium sp.]|nr:hypothetical protein [Solobacterium sp.]
MWTLLLSRIHEEPEARIIPNPVLDFTEKAKAGAFDALTNEEYEQEKENAEQSSALFERHASATTYTILLRALRSMEFTDSEMHTLLRALVSATVHTDFKKGHRRKETAL